MSTLPSTPSRASVANAPGSARGWGREEGGARTAGLGGRSARPASELLGASQGQSSANFATPETEAIDRWFEDLQHYEATLEDMAAASLDANFKEELSAIEQWFRVLSESERTAALYSLLQSSTQVQMRFFVTVLQQMARTDPTAALLSPANPGQASMEAQMEAKLATMGLKGPTAPAVRQYARQSLGADPYLSPHSAASATGSIPSPTTSTGPAALDDPAAATLASQRAKLKANSRISAPANMLLSGQQTLDTGLKSPMMWNERDKVSERRSPSPGGLGSGISRPKSTGSAGDAYSNGGLHASTLHSGQSLSQSTGPPPTSSYLRSPAVNHSIANDYENQLSPIVGGSWASMVNTPLVPMFGNRNGDDGMAQGDYGLASPSLEGASMRLGNWSSSDGTSSEGIVLDDVRKFRRSARVSSAASPGFGVPNGALSGMYDEHAQLQQQQQRRPLSQHNSSQQNAINLGLAGLSLQASQQQQQQSQNRNGAASPGLLSAQQSAITAQQNWRNGLGSPNPLNSADPLGSSVFAQQLNAFGMNSALQNTGNLSANAQLANLFALQQQMMQQQQMQQLGMAAAAAGMSLTPNQLLGMQQQQAMLSPGRMSMGGMSPMMGMSQSRRSPRSNDRSPGGNPKSNNAATAPGSGSNPDEPLDMALLGDIPNWLRSLRLHKYTPNFESSNWREMIMLDDAGLDAKGVSALGARRKLLGVFETIRDQMGITLPGGLPDAPPAVPDSLTAPSVPSQ